MRKLRPFFSYFGSKFRLAKLYGEPRHDIIVEPFAGSAGYALNWYWKPVLLIERDARIAALWRYLLRVKPDELLHLPDLEPDQTVDTLAVIPEVRTLIGLWLRSGTSTPSSKPSAWMTDGTRTSSFWGSSLRWRLAGQVESIRHWNIIEADHTNAPDIEATWFVDAPYQRPRRGYRHGADRIDFDRLRAWVLARSGQIVVCENGTADWLPFRSLTRVRSMPGRIGVKYSDELIWTNESVV